MSEAPYTSKIDRRTALAWVGVVGAALAGGAGVVVYGPKMGGAPLAKGTEPIRSWSSRSRRPGRG